MPDENLRAIDKPKASTPCTKDYQWAEAGAAPKVTSKDPAENGQGHTDAPGSQKGPTLPFRLLGRVPAGLKRVFRWVKSVGFHNWIMLAATVAIAITTILYTGYSNKQWGVMLEANKLNREAINRSAGQFRVDERAWIEIDSIKKLAVPPMQGFPPSFKYEVYLKNVGKTIARDVVLRRVTSLGTYPDARAIQMTQEKLLKPTSNDPVPVPPYPIPRGFAPNAVLPIPFTLGGTIPLENYTYYYSLIGRIDYTDAFGTAHWMTFCFVVASGAGGLQYCEYGNDEDRNPQTPPVERP